MASACKRKRTTNPKNTSIKRPKIADESWWAVKKILDERTRNGQLEYQIDWEGINEKTGKPWPPEWRSEADVADDIIEQWEEEKGKAEPAGPKRTVKPKKASTSSTSRAHRAQAEKLRSPRLARRATRKSRIVESSSPDTSRRSSTASSELSSPPSSPLASPSRSASPVHPALDHISPVIRVDTRSSFEPDEYKRYSQLRTSTSSLARAEEPSSSSSQRAHTSLRSYRSSGIVYDSEGEDGSHSYIPTTQTASCSAQWKPSKESLTVSTPREEQLESVSPAVSIPETQLETQPETVEDSQGEREIPDTFETVVSSSQQQLPQTPVQEGLDSSDKERKEPAQEQEASDHIPQQEAERNTTEETTLLDSTQSQPTVETFPEKDPSAVVPAEATLAQPGPLSRKETNLNNLTTSTTQREVDNNRTGTQVRLSEATSLPVQAPSSAEQEQQAQELDEHHNSHPSSQAIATENSVLVDVSPCIEEAPHTLTTSEVAEGAVQLGSQPAGDTNRDTKDSPEPDDSQGSVHTGFLTGSQSESPTKVQEETAQSLLALANSSPKDVKVTQDIVERRDFAIHTLESTSGSPATSIHSDGQTSEGPRHVPDEHDAQIVPTNLYLSTQVSAKSIHETVEQETAHVVSAHSRHDSSQQNPKKSTHGSSPLPRPPEHSLSISDTNNAVPPRPSTPHISQVTSPSLSTMDDQEDVGEAVRRAIREGTARRLAERAANTPRRSAFQVAQDAGTRSPSAIPDRSPLPQVPTSLRTVATASSIMPESAEPTQAAYEGESASSENQFAPVEVRPAAGAAVSTDSELSDADDESVLSDGLPLLQLEYIIPLPIEKRQAKMYSDEIYNRRDILTAFAKDPQGFGELDKIEDTLRRLRAVETHVDLLYSESQSQHAVSSTQFQHQAQWSYDNSVKFRFIGTLLDKLRARDMHLILVTEKDDERLFGIIESFLAGKAINFKSPQRGRQAETARAEGQVMVTVLSSESSPIVRPPDAIVCLDGCLDGSQIRKKNWAVNPDRGIVPIFHLVIPKTVDHIQRYVSQNLGTRRRLHTVIASLAQFQGEYGKALDPRTHSPDVAAAGVVEYLDTMEEEGPEAHWPLLHIGSIKEVIEFQSQQSQESIASPAPEAPPVASSKRPLEAEELDPAKRMRFTPQPQMQAQHQPGSSENKNKDVSHISDSLPDTAVQLSKLQEQVKTERALRKAAEKRFREHQASWERQQSTHEDLSKKYAELKKENEGTKAQLEVATKREAQLRERLETKATEHQELLMRFKQLQDTTLLSEDEETAEIARLRKELADAKDSEQRALKKAHTSESTLEFVKEQYREAQNAATTLSTQNEELSAKLKKVEHLASGETSTIQRLHYERQEKLAAQQHDALVQQLSILKKQLQLKEDELVKVKNGRGVGLGTRANSVGPSRTPRPGSRAASPLPVGNRDRWANLRNG